MRKLGKYLKPFTFNIVVLLVLLFVQALLDLSLPSLMSDIVNTGISKNGIEHDTPEVISIHQMENLLYLVESDTDKEFIRENYIFEEQGFNVREPQSKEIKKFPTLLNYEFYRLKPIEKDVLKKLDDIFELPTAKLNAIYRSKESLLKENHDEFLDFYHNNDFDFENEEETLQGTGFLFVRGEYIKLGADMAKIQTNYILSVGKVMLIVALLVFASIVAVGLLASRIATGISKNLRNDLFEKIISFSSSEFNSFSTSSLITRTTNDVQQIQTLIVMSRFFIFAPFMGVGGIIRIVNTSTELSKIVFISIVIIMISVMITFKFVMPRFSISQKLNDKMNLVLRERLTGNLVIRAFNTEKHEEKRFEEVSNDLRENTIFLIRVMASLRPMMTVIMSVTGVAVLWFGAIQVNNGSLMTGDIMKFVQYSNQIMFSFLIVGMLSIMVPRAAISTKRIFEVLETDYVILDPETPKASLDSKKGEVEFKNVSFAYPDADEKVLENISFVAKTGEMTAFIGSTGSGKSTLINLIPRFYDISEGEVLVEGINVKEYNLKKLRQKIGFIPQKAMLFRGTIESNIKYGDKDVSDEEMFKAAEISQSTDFIQEKDEKYEDQIAQGGANVSGGQRQRLSIARAIARDPNIFIFDDSFSALDNTTDAKLRNALTVDLGDRTTLVVAQKISTIQEADQIIVLDEGKIIAKGKHKWLLENCEIYYQIASSQLSEEELTNG